MSTVLDTPAAVSATSRYAKCIAASKRIRWDIDLDVIRGRQFDFGMKFLPDGLSRVKELAFLSPREARFASQVMGRTYANMFGMIERYIGPKILEISRDYWLGDQVALEALVRFTDEELKHQELFRRIEEMVAAGMPPGYRFKPRANEVAGMVLGKSTWAVLGLTLDIELFTLAHYRSSIDPDADLSPLWKDVFLHHWKEESQHAIVNELEWRREDGKLGEAERDRAVDDLIALVAAIDDTLQVQAAEDAEYFVDNAGRAFTGEERNAIHATWLRAYRWQYIVTGVREPRFLEALGSMVTPAQMQRVSTALAPIVAQSAG
jgi:hypothetical protein